MNYMDWHRHFQNNIHHFDHIDWTSPDELTQQEKEAIFTSIQQFQKGENSEGKNLIRFARESNLPDYLDTIIVFIREEQRHAIVLGEFMKLHDIPKIKEHWVDNFFRKIRTFAGLENSVLVLITAEIIAAIYYKALLNATNSRILRALCTQILKDEEMHINFQSFTLRQFHEQRHVIGNLFVRLFHRILMTGTIVVVWYYHSRVLRRGGYGFITFFTEVFEEFQRSENMIIGRKNIAAIAESPQVVL